MDKQNEFKDVLELFDVYGKKLILIGIELTDDATYLHEFKHPDNCVYLLGSEDRGLPKYILDECDSVIKIYCPKKFSMNVATAGTLIMNDRVVKQISKLNTLNKRINE